MGPRYDPTVRIDSVNRRWGTSIGIDENAEKPQEPDSHCVSLFVCKLFAKFFFICGFKFGERLFTQLFWVHHVNHSDWCNRLKTRDFIFCGMFLIQLLI